MVIFLQKSFIDIVGERDGLLTREFAALSFLPATRIHLEFPDNRDDSRFDTLEIENLARDLKVDGIQYLVDETTSSLKEHFITISNALLKSLAANDFHIHRINKTAMCIVSFSNTIIRDDVFYSYINMVKGADHQGILKCSIPSVPATTNITLNDHLCISSRIIYNFCRNFKRDRKMHGLSTRRGRIIIKINPQDAWTLVSSLDHLHSLLPNNSMEVPAPSNF